MELYPDTTYQPTSVKPSAVKAGWICFVIGILTFWVFGLGFFFLGLTIVLSVVAMCTNQITQGLILLFSSIASMVLCFLIFFFLIFGTFGAAALKVSEDLEKQSEMRFRHPHELDLRQ